MTRRRLLALVGAALGLMAGAAFVAPGVGAPGAGAATPTITVERRDDGAPVTVDPGAHAATTLVVTNHDTRAHTVRLWLAPGPGEVPTWLLLADTEVTLSASSSLDVVVSADPPSTAPPGRIDIGAAAQVVDDGVPGATAPTTPFGIVVRGTPSAVVRIASVTATASGRAPTVRVEVRNDGAVAADLDGALTIAPSGERLPLRVHVGPRTASVAALRWTPPRTGRATGRIELVDGDESVSWSGVLGGAPVRPTTAPAPATAAPASIAPVGTAGGLPWGSVLVVLGLLAASGWLGYEIVAGRRDGHTAPTTAAGAPVQALPVEQLAPLVDAIALLSASIGGRPPTPNAVTLPSVDTLRTEVLGLVASGLGVSRLRLLDWLPDELFDRAVVELSGEPEHDRLVIQLRAAEIEREILRRALERKARAES